MVLHAWRLRATIVAVAALVAAAALASCASGSAGRSAVASPAATPTTSATPAAPVRATTTAAHVFAAFDSTGAPAAGVAAHRSGTCWTSSITVSSRDAYRCISGNAILDPCFAASAAASARVVDCYASPWTKAVQLALKATLPAPGAPLKISQPWAIEVGAGTRCVVTTGTAPIVRGVAMRYQCDTGTAGLLSTGGPLLEVQLQTAAGAVQRAAVVGAWTA
jgi:hypothetical protein